MKLRVINTYVGLVPVDDDSCENKSHLKLNDTYDIEIKQTRNYKFLCKYMSMIRAAYSMMSDSLKEHYKRIENFRDTIILAAGYVDTVYSIKRNELVEIPKSISFDKMDEDEFEKLYSDSKSVILEYFLNGKKIEEFENIITKY